MSTGPSPSSSANHAASREPPLAPISASRISGTSGSPLCSTNHSRVCARVWATASGCPFGKCPEAPRLDRRATLARPDPASSRCRFSMHFESETGGLAKRSSSAPFGVEAQARLSGRSRGAHRRPWSGRPREKSRERRDRVTPRCHALRPISPRGLGVDANAASAHDIRPPVGGAEPLSAAANRRVPRGSTTRDPSSGHLRRRLADRLPLGLDAAWEQQSARRAGRRRTATAAT